MTHQQIGSVASYTLPGKLKRLQPLLAADFLEDLGGVSDLKSAGDMLDDYGPYFMGGAVFGAKLEVSSVSNKSEHASGMAASAAMQAEYNSGIASGKVNMGAGYSSDKASSKYGHPPPTCFLLCRLSPAENTYALRG